METMFKRLFSLAIALVMVIGLMPWNAASVYATEEDVSTVETDSIEEPVEEPVQGEAAEEAPVVGADAIVFDCKHCDEEVEWLPLDSATVNQYLTGATAAEIEKGANNWKNGHYYLTKDTQCQAIDLRTSGMIVLDSKTMDQFAYNTAYYIVEVESPNGYYVSPEPYYFYIVNDNTQDYPSCIPKDFNGHALASGDIIYRENVSATTEISIEKYWKDYGGDFTTVTKDKVSSITVELWHMLQGNPDSAKSYGTYTITPDDNGNWRFTITDLPKATKNQNGTRGTNYLYYIKEVKVNGYTLESAENNSGINSGTITLVNREVEGYVLPETGGTGTQMYTTAGLLLMLTSAAYLMYIHLKRRREETNSP